MPGFLRVVDLEAVRTELERLWTPSPRICEVPLSSAYGRIVVGDVVSPIDLPPFDRAAYDGYAVVASDTFGADEENVRRLFLVGEIAPGAPPKLRIRRGTCARISTGAALPGGADAVLMSEHAEEQKGEVVVRRAVAPGENVTRRGSDIRRGETLVRDGTVLTPAHIGAIAAAGVGKVRVRKKPRVAIISTGDELIPQGRRLSPGRIYDSNGPALVSAVMECGGDPVYMGITRDNARAIRSKVVRAFRSCDIVLISGGTSAGRGDLVPEIIGGMRGAKILAHGLAQKPGKPALVALVGKKLVFGLPGYPTSSLMVFDLLVGDQIRRLSGMSRSERHTVRAFLAQKVISAPGRREFLPVRLRKENKKLVAHPVLKDSGAIASLSSSDGYIEIPAETEIVREGEEVEVRLLRGLPNA
ncbi:MAG: molybdopterin-binding protein [Candidatus Hadarchaeales archaeon]